MAHSSSARVIDKLTVDCLAQHDIGTQCPFVKLPIRGAASEREGIATDMEVSKTSSRARQCSQARGVCETA